MANDIPETVLEAFRAVLSPAGVTQDPDELVPHLREWRGLYQGSTPAMLSPASRDEAAEILAICHAHRIGVVPQGGNTGLVGGGIPHSSPDRPQVLLSASRLNAIRRLDADNFTVTAEAGCVLARIQEAAASVERIFPLSLAAEGSCQIGGNISTNAGGINVLRYGSARDLVLGLEVVLPDGRILDTLRSLRKDNTGYDLKHLFIGAEGTLGFITAATCKLFPKPQQLATAIVALAGPQAAVDLYGRARLELGDRLIAVELINRLAMDLVLTHIPATRHPLDRSHDWYVLLELAGAGADDLDTALERFLAGSLDEKLINTAALASSGAQRAAFWHLRHSISEAQKHAGAGIKHDIAVPVAAVPEFLSQADPLVLAQVPGARIVAFGHLGDGNLHYNLNQPADLSAEKFLAHRESVSAAVHELAVGLGGSFSAEHGIGALKREELARYRSGVELDIMRALKKTLDPAGIMNPGKLFPPKPDSGIAQ